MIPKEVLKESVGGLDSVYEVVETFNPNIGEYIMKPSHMVTTATEEGITSLGNKVMAKAAKLFGSFNIKTEGSDFHDISGVGKVFHGLIENTVVQGVKEGKVKMDEKNKYADEALGLR